MVLDISTVVSSQEKYKNDKELKAALLELTSTLKPLHGAANLEWKDSRLDVKRSKDDEDK